ncbi:SET domain-containing protein [Paraburkholderia sp. GAS42]|uniref:SET domain-containing protein n=1 Tax=Paraburkholderia sp. GAS42 TaxID=3035135 RepID=UPI003D25CCC9
MSETPRAGRPRFVVRRSPVHGRGLFANRIIAAAEFLCEYKGARVNWTEVLDQLPNNHSQPGHTFFFDVEAGVVIDGSKGGNSARWLNHACSPNCEAELSNGRIFIYALCDISPGEELTLDYGLILDRRCSRKVKEQFRCRCTSPDCKGTMLEERRRKTQLCGHGEAR